MSDKPAELHFLDLNRKCWCGKPIRLGYRLVPGGIPSPESHTLCEDGHKNDLVEPDDRRKLFPKSSN